MGRLILGRLGDKKNIFTESILDSVSIAAA
jgi:hypothetical protein